MADFVLLENDIANFLACIWCGYRRCAAGDAEGFRSGDRRVERRYVSTVTRARSKFRAAPIWRRRIPSRGPER